MSGVDIGGPPWDRGGGRESGRKADSDEMQSRRALRRRRNGGGAETRRRRRRKEKSGASGSDGEEMSFGAVGPRDGGDVDDVLEVGTVRPRVDRRRLSDRGFGDTTDARQRCSVDACVNGYICQ